MEWLIAPFEIGFVQRALWGGLLVSGVCALAGTWVVVRGMAFLGEAMAHGLLPGVAVAALVGGNPVVGAAFSAAAIAAGVTALGRGSRFAADTAIGLLFAGMLSLGVIIVSRSQSFAVDVTGMLFGDVLAIRDRDLVYLAVALGISLIVTVLGHRAFVALAFDSRTAHTLGLRPRWAHAVLLGLLTLAIVASFQVVGTLLVFGLLIAPPAAATYWSDRIPVIMGLAAVFGGFATVAGLLVSWHAGTAAGASIAAVAVGVFFVSALASRIRMRLSGTRMNPSALLLVLGLALPLAGCESAAEETRAEDKPHGYVEGAQETDSAQPRLVVVDPTGGIRTIDLLTEQIADGGRLPGATRIAGDDRYAYPSGPEGLRIVDGGGWTVDHGDHVHYYRAAVRDLGGLPRGEVVAVHSDSMSTVMITGPPTAPETVLLDRHAQESGTVTERGVLSGLAVPLAEHLIVVSTDGRGEIRDRDGPAATALTESCPRPQGTAVTRRGVVFGCADGAVVVAAAADGFTATKIPYPDAVPAAERATDFAHRKGSTTLVARAGERGVWVLDIVSRTWRLVETGPVAAANTAGESSALLVLTRDGVLHAHDLTTGAVTAHTRVLAEPLTGATLPVIEIDTARAYINDSSGHAVHEIDYRDNLRRARTFALDFAPEHMVETGR
ncbi:zinc ABC transporter permease AztB [Nocardia sp. CDC160]|uniref:zinc ABC transporter permease AztB n=1 Tax=Nocardia sp. CDC160 TaxID=3112166 RepID=UPI002DC05D17|nr:zinc ABC transporter permease AztB [Nocardia sp. CDC160]MEC3918816.1 zinc ABC transporter permease AztB [Nocardia sp. CDC160]